jgi:hypothetical protein
MRVWNAPGPAGTPDWSKEFGYNFEYQRWYFDDELIVGGTLTVDQDTFFVDSSTDKVGVGTKTPQEKLSVDGNVSVNGTVFAKEVKVDLTVPWADFVFTPGYNLPSLSEVASYIKDNKRLPNFPAAAEIQKNGLSMAEMMTKQMQKIEELTLYMIDMQKENEALKARLSALETENNMPYQTHIPYPR